MDAEKMMKLQMQLSQNNNDLVDYMKDLTDWQDDIKIKEAKLNNDNPKILTLPSIRNLPAKKAINTPPIKEKKAMPAPYSLWDKFDADRACEELDANSEDNVNIEKLVEKFKSEGNEYFKRNKLKEALECYTKGLELDSSNINLLANRALVLLKQQNYTACEMDCNVALSLENTNVKCLLRRGTARSKLKKYKDALNDFEIVLNIEKNNSLALTEAAALKQLIKPIDTNIVKSHENQKSVVKAIYKPLDQRSKAPMKRINIDEINLDKIDTEIKSKNIPISVKKEGLKNMSTDNVKTSSSIIMTESSSVSRNISNRKLVTSEIKNLEDNFSLASENSFQFQKAWKQLRDDEQFFTYFSLIEPKNYPKIFGECLEYNMLSKIWNILKNFYLVKELDTKLVLLNLPRINRFQMNMMFLTPNDKIILNYLITNCKNLNLQEETYLRDIYNL